MKNRTPVILVGLRGRDKEGVKKRLIFQEKHPCIRNVSSLCLPVLKIAFTKSDILMPGLLVLLLQYFVVIPCVPGAHGLLFVLSTQYTWLIFAFMIHTEAPVFYHPLIFGKLQNQ